MDHLKAAPLEIKWSPALPIFASEPFLRSVGDEYGWLGGTDEAGVLRCVLPFTIIQRPGFRIVRFRVETIALRKDLSVEAEKSFLNDAMKHFRSLGADMVIPANNTALFRTYPDGALVAPYGTIIQCLTKQEDELISEIHKTYRYNIRSAIRAEVQVKSGMQYLDNAYALITETLKRSGLAFRSYSYFRNMVLSLGENVRIFVADHHGVIQGCMVAPFSEHSAYTWYCGSRPQPVMGAMHLIHWEAMRYFREVGVRRFNFAGVRISPKKGSKQEGIKNFKMRFGGQVVEGYMWKYSFRPLKCAAYSVAAYLVTRGERIRFARGGAALEVNVRRGRFEGGDNGFVAQLRECA